MNPLLFAQQLLSQRAAWETKESESYCFGVGEGEAGEQIPMFEQFTLFGVQFLVLYGENCVEEKFILRPMFCSDVQAQSERNSQTT